jgi:hypothetical protein
MGIVGIERKAKMSTATFERERVIDGRLIERRDRVDTVTHQRYAWFREVRVTPLSERTSFNPRTGATIAVLDAGTTTVVWDSGAGPGELFEGKIIELSGGGYGAGPVPFDPREPDGIWDEYERAVAGGFPAWGAQLLAMAKIKARPEITGRFALGEVSVQPGTRGDAATIRRFLREHITVAPIELTEDEEWGPPLRGVHVENEVAIRSGSGLVRTTHEIEVPAMSGAVYPVPTGKTKKLAVHFWTLLDRPATIVF